MRKRTRAGRRVGQKRSDKRFIAPGGVEWASKFEWEVYDVIRGTGAIVRKCGKGDSFSYHEPKRGGKCLACGSDNTVQERIYTPDLHITLPPEWRSGPGEYYIEVKGYFRQQRRALFGHFLKQHPDVDMRIVFETDGRATPRLTYREYAQKYYKVPVVVGIAELIGSDWLI